MNAAPLEPAENSLHTTVQTGASPRRPTLVWVLVMFAFGLLVGPLVHVAAADPSPGTDSSSWYVVAHPARTGLGALLVIELVWLYDFCITGPCSRVPAALPDADLAWGKRSGALRRLCVGTGRYSHEFGVRLD